MSTALPWCSLVTVTSVTSSYAGLRPAYVLAKRNDAARDSSGTGSFQSVGAGKGQPILLDFVEQDAPARAHSLELNMPLACLLKLPALARIPLADLLAHAWTFISPF